MSLYCQAGALRVDSEIAMHSRGIFETDRRTDRVGEMSMDVDTAAY